VAFCLLSGTSDLTQPGIIDHHGDCRAVRTLDQPWYIDHSDFLLPKGITHYLVEIAVCSEELTITINYLSDIIGLHGGETMKNSNFRRIINFLRPAIVLYRKISDSRVSVWNEPEVIIRIHRCNIQT